MRKAAASELNYNRIEIRLQQVAGDGLPLWIELH